MILMTVKYYVKEGLLAEVLSSLREMEAEVRTKEPDCLSYKVWQSRDEANLLLLEELYANDAAIEAHRQTEHFKTILEPKVLPLLNDRVREFYTPQIG